ncbi:unnamed protein product [Alopecurus aequalis]
MPPTKYKTPRAAADPLAVKVRKPRAPKPRQPGFTNAEWKADIDRRSVVSGRRAMRGEAKKKRGVAAAEEEASRAIMANDRHQPMPPHASQYAQGVWAASQQSVVSPAPASFSPPVWNYSSSPDYADGDALGGFNPNTAFQARAPPAFAIDPRAPPAFAIDPQAPLAFAIDPHGPPPFGPPRGPAFTADLNSPYRYSPAYSSSPNLRHGAFPFGPGSSSTPQFSTTDREINDMIATGSAAAAASEGFYVDSQDLGAETEYNTEHPGVAEEVEEVDAPDPRMAGKRKKRAPTAQKQTKPRLKWTPKEDECLVEAWKTISIDPITVSNQIADNYWRRVKMAFDERKLVDPEFAGLHTERGEKAMANHWAVIQQACNKWHGIQEEVVARPESGANIERQNKEAVYNPDAPVTGVAEGRPIGNKKAKAAGNMAPAADRLQASIDQCIADAKSHAVVMEEKSEARWSALMKKQDDKLTLLRTNVATKKRKNELAFLMGADTESMDPMVRAWFMAEHAIILKQMPAQPANGEDPATTEDPVATEDPAIDDAAPTTGSASPTADDLTDASPSPTVMDDDLVV